MLPGIGCFMGWSAGFGRDIWLVFWLEHPCSPGELRLWLGLSRPLCWVTNQENPAGEVTALEQPAHGRSSDRTMSEVPHGLCGCPDGKML